MKTKSLLGSVLGVGAFLLAGTFAPATFAQNGTQEQNAPPPASQPAPAAREHGEGRFAGLNLTEDQKQQIKKIHEGAKAKADAVMADTSLSDGDKQAKVRKIHHLAMRQTHGVLTSEQRAQLKATRRERRAERSQSPSA
jgi:Spy/CpxP family protein refolding chaperone